MPESQPNSPEDLYQYDGWLVFNQLFETEQFDEELNPPEILDSFPQYSRGTPNEPDSGFSRTDFPEHLSGISELTKDLEAFAESLYSFKYTDEDWLEQWGYDENANEQVYFLDGRDEIDIFWDFANQIMMIRGEKQLINRKSDDIRGGLSEELQLNSVEFDFDFFLWVLYKEYRGENLSSDLRVRRLTRGKTQGTREDYLGKNVHVEGTEDILRCLMMIAPVLAGKRIHSLQGDFVMNRNILQAEIEHTGKVHVKVTNNPLSNMSDLRRMGISLRFLSELVSLFDHWSNLDRDNRYPPPRFFDDLGDLAEEQGWDPKFDPTEVKEEYRRKRSSVDESKSTAPA